MIAVIMLMLDDNGDNDNGNDGDEDDDMEVGKDRECDGSICIHLLLLRPRARPPCRPRTLPEMSTSKILVIPNPLTMIMIFLKPFFKVERHKLCILWPFQLRDTVNLWYLYF